MKQSLYALAFVAAGAALIAQGGGAMNPELKAALQKQLDLEKLRELFFANMSERGAKILREEMAAMGPVRLRDVEEAQQLIVTMAKQLAASGEIFLADGREDELVY